MIEGWSSISGSLLVSPNGGPALSPDYIHVNFILVSWQWIHN